MADPGFNNERYWARRNAEKAFRAQWYEWRKEIKEVYTAPFVNGNPQMFTQRAFMNYLQIAAMQTEEEAKAGLEPLHAEAIPPSEEGITSSVKNDNVLVTDIAPESSTNEIKL